MLLTVVTPPGIEPLTLAQAKAHLRVDVSDDDDLITALITAARQWCETITARAFLTTTFRAAYPGFPGATGILGVPAYGIDPLWLPGTPVAGTVAMRYALRLPRSNVQAVSIVTYVNGDGLPVTLDESDYVLSSDDVQAFLTPVAGTMWPITLVHPQAVAVEFTAGYGDTPSSVPLPIQQAMLLLTGHFYENREAVSVSRFTPAEVPITVDALLSPYSVVEVP